MSHFRRVILVVLILGFLVPVFETRGDTYVFNVDTKQKEKAKNRWSLSEWLETRDRMRMMDLWLAMHSPSPYEFYLTGAHRFGKRENDAYYGGWNLGFTAYATIFGLELGWDSFAPSSRLFGLFHLRLMGYHNQATNLTVTTGVKQESRAGESLWSPQLGLSMTVYLAKFFGINALYRHSFSPLQGSGGASGDRLEGGAFIDFNFVRIFADYFKEVEVGNRAFSYSGVQLGTRLYF